MPREKKEREAKFYEAPVVVEQVKKILSSCATFSYMNLNDFQILFKKGKNTLGKKHVSIKLIKEPISLSTTKKLTMLVTRDWWEENIDSDRVKGLIESLLGIMTDEDGTYVKRDYDIQTYDELLVNSDYDYSEFSKVLPAEAKPETLVLTPK
jgi:hypothetical protein